MFKSVVLTAAAVATLGTMSLAEGRGHAAQTAHCPPGLAKKSPACVPPGLAYRTADIQDWRDRLDIGERVDQVQWLDLQDYSLPILPYGQRYAVIDNVVVIVDRQSLTVLSLVNLLANLS